MHFLDQHFFCITLLKDENLLSLAYMTYVTVILIMASNLQFNQYLSKEGKFVKILLVT
jgi:hypothetical protein